MSQCQLSVTLNGRHLKLPDIKAGARGEQTWSGKGSVIKRVITLLVDCKEKHQKYTWFKPKPNDIFIMPRSYMWKISVPGLKRKERPKTNFYTLVSDWSCAGFQLGLGCPFPPPACCSQPTCYLIPTTWAVNCTFQTLFSVILPWDIPIELQIVTKNILFTFSHGPFSVCIEWHIEVRVVYGGCQQCTESTFQIWCDKRRNPIHCPSKNAV